MASVAIDLDDAGLMIARDGEVIDAGPGYAALVGGQLCFGREAAAVATLTPRLVQRRHWLDLAERPLPVALGDCHTPADLVQRHLQAVWARCDGADSAVLVTMPGWSTEQLALLLGIARDIGMPVAALVDGAVAASRRPWPGRALWHLHVGLHATALTRIGQEGGAVRGERIDIERLGVERLERGCAEFLARRFVACARFDPLHDATSEQALRTAMAAWLLAAARAERVEAVLERDGQRFQAWFDGAELRAHVAAIAEPLVQRLRLLLSPREPSVLQVQARLAGFPGLVEALMRLPACSVVLLEPAAAARGALRALRAVAPADGLRLTTALAWDQPADENLPAPTTAAGQAPTHVACAGRLWRLGAKPFIVGTDIGAASHGLQLDAGTQGVSRRHCSIQLEGGNAVVHDQSRYGTRLNGHRVQGSAVLQAGDVLALGEPPRELLLLAEVGRGA